MKRFENILVMVNEDMLQAETILHEIDSSVVTLKPTGFESIVR